MAAFEQRFKASGNDYDAALERTVGDRELLSQLMSMFLADGSFDALKTAIGGDDCKAAFAAAHSLKGSSGMLGMTALFASASEITELLRAGDLATAKTVFPKLSAEYDAVSALIRESAEI